MYILNKLKGQQMTNITFSIFELKKHNINEITDLINFITNSLKFKYVKNGNDADYIISYGGDGTLLDAFQKFPNKIIIPIRDYARCNYHNDILNYFKFTKVVYKDVLKCTIDNKELFGISEVVIRNANISQAIRFDLYINDNPYILNSIGDGLIISTVLGSTGYFKNITNTFFSEGIGIGFLNSTQRMANLIIPNDSSIKIVINRGNVELAVDHNELSHLENQIIEIKKDNEKSLKLLGYKSEFMCNSCRNLRHSGYVNSIFNIIN